MLISYAVVRLLHVLAAFIAAGPLFLTPWVAASLSIKDPSLIDRLAVLKQVEDIWSRLGWALVVTGLGLFALSDWSRGTEPWFLLAIGIFLVDIPVERWLREPAIQQLRQVEGNRTSDIGALHRLRLGVGLQTLGVAAIIVLMIRQSVI